MYFSCNVFNICILFNCLIVIIMRSCFSNIFYPLDSTIELKVYVLDESNCFSKFLDSSDYDFVPIGSIIAIKFNVCHEFDLINHRSLGISTLESSLIHSSLVMNFVE